MVRRSTGLYDTLGRSLSLSTQQLPIKLLHDEGEAATEQLRDTYAHYISINARFILFCAASGGWN